MIALRVISGVANHFIMRLPEWGNTVIMLNFGITLLQSGNTFDQPAFAVMRHYASEDTWGGALTAIAFIRLCALTLNGTVDWFAPWSVRIRALSATFSCFGWFCISLGLYLGSYGSPGWKTYTAHLVVDIILAIYLGGQAGKIDRGLRNGSA